jgi:murein DD-endopeptidase MepM/ murein hydrolase activator NlpD
MRGSICNVFNREVILSSTVIFTVVSLCLLLSSSSPATADVPIKIGPPLDSLQTKELRDSFNEIHQGHRHEAIDIMRPRGTPVLAVTDGVIRKLFISRPGGLTIYEFDQEGVYCFYYAHLDHYADQIREGRAVARGEVIGYVGTSGDAAPDAPQLHFAISRLGADKQWWKSEAINPYPILMKAASEANSSPACFLQTTRH